MWDVPSCPRVTGTGRGAGGFREEGQGRGTHVLPVQTGIMNLSEMCVTRDRVFPRPSQTKSVAPGEIVCGGVGWGGGLGGVCGTTGPRCLCDTLL